MTATSVIDINNIKFIPAARVPKLNTARYAFVRCPHWREQNPREETRTPLHHALYDIVDNGEGTEQVLAYGVRYNAASLIVSALNAVEEASRIEAQHANDAHAIRTAYDQQMETEMPPPAA